MAETKTKSGGRRRSSTSRPNGSRASRSASPRGNGSSASEAKGPRSAPPTKALGKTTVEVGKAGYRVGELTAEVRRVREQASQKN